MKIENEEDIKQVEVLVNAFNKASLAGFTGGDAYPIFKSLEWLARGVREFKQKPVPPTPTAPTSTTQSDSKITSITTAKSRKK